MKKSLTALFGFLLWFCMIKAQSCNYTVQGYVLNQEDRIALEYSNVYVEETGKGSITDSLGYFVIDGLCEGSYHFRISHIGCEPEHFHVQVKSDTTIQILLAHNSVLEEIEVIGAVKSSVEIQNKTQLSESQIKQESGRALGEILESVAGVSTINSGSGISKPVIHGLYGNRIAVLNNGIPQAGQQWGNDHAPEIDANIATKLTVIKGVSSLQYGGNTLGGIVLVEPGSISTDPHVHGSINWTIESNGLANTLAAKLEQSTKKLDWRINASASVSGDKRTSRYYLNNTGSRVYSTALQLNKLFKDKWSINGYYSYYKTEIGILRGSHVGNLTDLALAIERDEPYFTEDKFSFKLEAPKQDVQHHLAKFRVGYFNNHHLLKITLSSQINQRKEFDVRRNDRSDIPALSMLLVSNFFDVSYKLNHDNYTLSAGVQAIIEDNSNNPETGILPLIPDYDQAKTGLYVTFQKPVNKWTFELGGRYDFKWHKAITITRTVPRSIEVFRQSFHDYSFVANAIFNANQVYSTQWMFGNVKRSPAINELYSFGLHQGVSGIEKGDVNLLPEHSFKGIWIHEFKVKSQFNFEVSPYFQFIKDYIYLEPQEEPELTIRGAFPVFLYKSTDAILSGLDISASWEIKSNWKWNTQYSMVRGIDIQNNSSLVYIPADNIYSDLSYRFKPLKKLENFIIGLNGQYTFQQKKYEPTLDFLAPPTGYFLLGFKVSGDINLDKIVLKWNIKAENLLNTTYRDYLNRLRYYADEEGVSVRFGLQVEF